MLRGVITKGGKRRERQGKGGFYKSSIHVLGPRGTSTPLVFARSSGYYYSNV